MRHEDSWYCTCFYCEWCFKVDFRFWHDTAGVQFEWEPQSA